MLELGILIRSIIIICAESSNSIVSAMFPTASFLETTSDRFTLRALHLEIVVKKARWVNLKIASEILLIFNFVLQIA